MNWFKWFLLEKILNNQDSSIDFFLIWNWCVFTSSVQVFWYSLGGLPPSSVQPLKSTCKRTFHKILSVLFWSFTSLEMFDGLHCIFVSSLWPEKNRKHRWNCWPVLNIFSPRLRGPRWPVDWVFYRSLSCICFPEPFTVFVYWLSSPWLTLKYFSRRW